MLKGKVWMVAVAACAVVGVVRADDGMFDNASEPLMLQVASPANAAKDSAREAKTVDPSVPPQSRAESFSLDAKPRLRTYEMPPIVVTGENPDGLVSEDRIGPYEQPRWTATRRFTSTRVYVIPEGKVEFEYWYRPTFDGDTRETRTLYELEIGLPHRFQLDLYLRSDQENNENFEWAHQVELRYALADWGKIWGNPTLYMEYINHEDGPDQIEPKLLLGGELAPRWHWGVNLQAEMQTGGDREYEYEINGGVSYTVLDPSFSVGVEGKADFTTVQDNRSDYAQSYLLGPDLQWKPLPPVTINLVGLAGFGPDAPDAQVTLNIGYEF